MPLSVAVSGASGYAGGELLRLLSAHPDVEITTVTAHSNAGQPLIQHQPHLRSLRHLTLSETTPETLAGHFAFLAMTAPDLAERELRAFEEMEGDGGEGRAPYEPEARKTLPP